MGVRFMEHIWILTPDPAGTRDVADKNVMLGLAQVPHDRALPAL